MARSNAVGKLREIVDAATDPRTALLRALGDLSNETVLHSQVLVATYAGSKFHAGTSILRTDQSLKEDQFQGTVGLVVKMGKGAFVDQLPQVNFHGDTLEIGDWVFVRPSDGISLFIRQVPCRLFEDVHVKIKVNNPEMYW